MGARYSSGPLLDLSIASESGGSALSSGGGWLAEVDCSASASAL